MPGKHSETAARLPLIKVFGIKSCDTCRKALKWLEMKRIPHRFHDVRDRSPSQGLVELWCTSPYADRLVNRRSTTWRQLNGKQRAAALANPARVLLEHPTLLKRPLFMCDRDVLGVGFSSMTQESLISTMEGTA